jgi:hypothetical protein
MRKLFLSVALMAMICSSAMAATASEGLRSNVQKDYLNSVKITFLSWLSGSTKVSYERAFPGLNQSGELCGSLICAGYDKYDNDPLGFTVRYGHKFFMFDRDDVALKGFYLRPELMYSHYYYTRRTDGERTLANMGTLLGTVGYQYVWKRFLADFWVGGGYAVGTPAETNYHHGFELWHWFGTENKNLAMSFSIRLGLCF